MLCSVMVHKHCLYKVRTSRRRIRSLLLYYSFILTSHFSHDIVFIEFDAHAEYVFSFLRLFNVLYELSCDDYWVVKCLMFFLHFTFTNYEL